MTKFLNKKEQVIDLKLTTYGHYLLSTGRFKPTYYAFFDNNVIYDGAYASITESQKNIVHRIKNETPYIEGQTLFVDLEDRASNAIPDLDFFELDITPTREEVRPNQFRYDKAIGDAHLNGTELNFGPAWKIVLLNGQIIQTEQRDALNKLEVPQIDIALYYRKTIQDDTTTFNESAPYDAISETARFGDQRTISLMPDNAMVYVEEMNTDILTHNFDIEVFQILTSSYIDANGTLQEGTSSFIRKYFEREIPQIVDGIMKTPNPTQKYHEIIPSSSVEYYFDIYADGETDREIACRSMDRYNKQSYYVDLDLDCEGLEDEDIYNDIYGTGAEPEICLD